MPLIDPLLPIFEQPEKIKNKTKQNKKRADRTIIRRCHRRQDLKAEGDNDVILQIKDYINQKLLG